MRHYIAAQAVVPALAAPTIKGIFVNSHIEAVRRELGEPGVRQLEHRFGRPLRFRPTDDVAVRDEVRLIEHALDLLAGPIPDPSRRAYEAGRLHFRDFTTTPWAKMMFALFPKNFKFMMLHAKTVAERVFKGVSFDSEEIGPTAVRIVMANNDYPIEHFRGLFYEWLRHFGCEGEVRAQDLGAGRYEYTAVWT